VKKYFSLSFDLVTRVSPRFPPAGKKPSDAYVRNCVLQTAGLVYAIIVLFPWKRLCCDLHEITPWRNARSTFWCASLG